MSNYVKWGRLCFFFFTLFQLSTVPLCAEQLQQTDPVKAELVSEDASIQPGRPFWVAVELKMADGWDTYWLNPGDSGFATQVNWHLPEGFKAGPLQWPYPQQFVNDSLVGFGYTDRVMLMSEITPPNTLSGNSIELKADVQWLACKESCVPGNATLSLTLPVTNAEPSTSSAATLFQTARTTLPQKGGELTATAQADQIILKLKLQPGLMGVEGGLFIPEKGEVIDYMAPQIFSVENGLMTLSVKRVNPVGELNSVKGVILLKEKGSEIKRAIAVDTAFETSQPEKAHFDGVSSLTVALGLAFLGGLILNVMPCVLPVIALKIFGFVKMAQQKRGEILKHGGIFALGVLISFWLLSGALLLLRAYGEGIGWGFQLQEPIFVVILASMLFLLGLSLFGVFELGTSLIALGSKSASSERSPLMSSFMSGVLATLVATPCTGPLLGPALGFAMTLPVVQALTIFTAMGLGMASPYLIFSAFPKLVRFLPKPGNWMIAFKQMMGFLMMATVAWLIWVFGAQTGNLATFILLISLLFMAIGAWIFGTWGALHRKKLTRMIATTFAALIIGLSIFSSINMAKKYREASSSSPGMDLVSDQSGWEIYSPERVESLRGQGIPVFVDFTAKWCLICQANRVTLHSSDVENEFRQKGVVTMIADWTKRDAVISKELEKMGRTGVPVYVLYPGNHQDAPLILPQTLTTGVMHDYLSRLKERSD